MTRATKLHVTSVSTRWVENDYNFKGRMLQERRTRRSTTILKLFCMCVPPGRRAHRRAATHTCRFSTLPRPPGKLVFYAHCEVEPFRTFCAPIDDVGKVPVGESALLIWVLSSLLASTPTLLRSDPRLAKSHMRWGGTPEWRHSGGARRGNWPYRQRQPTQCCIAVRGYTERLAEQNRQIAARNKGMPKGSPAAAAAAPLYRGYTQAQYGTSGTAPACIDCRAALLVA